MARAGPCRLSLFEKSFSLSVFLTCSRLGRLVSSVLPFLVAFLAGSSCQLLSPAPGEASCREEAAGRSAMSSHQQSDVPGGYFVGRPTNHAGDQNPATEQTPGDYFVGRPGKDQQEAGQQQQTTKQSTPSFLAKCCPCLAGGGAAE